MRNDTNTAQQYYYIMKTLNYLMILTLTAIITLSSCKLDQAQETKDDTGVKGNEALNLSQNRNLNDQELYFLEQNCEALESRAIELRRAIGLKLKYSFSVSSTLCAVPQAKTSHKVYVSAPADTEEKLRYYPQNGSTIPSFNYLILTNESKYMNSLCESVLSLNVVTPKLIEKIGSEYVKYRFYKNGGFEYFIYKNVNGKWISRNFESYEINLQKSSDDFGMVTSQTTGTFCDNGSQSFYTQTLK